MKKCLIIVMLTMFSNVYSHREKVVRKVYNNIDVTTYNSFHTEEMNKTLMIAQYAEMLSKKLSYNDKIYLNFSETKLEQPTINVWLPKKDDNTDNIDGINITFRIDDFDVVGCLNIIESAILNKNELKKLSERSWKVYKNLPSVEVSNILKAKIYRPNEIKELEKPPFFNYYFQDGKFHFVWINSENEKELNEFEKIKDFYVLTNYLLVVVSDNEEIKLIKPNQEIQTLKVDDVENFYRPYEIKLIGNNKISIGFNQLSRNKNRLLLYFMEKNILIQNVDELIKN
ncbi:hypothetical protein H9X57_11285 [Flavobacterium piscinae]|uniref:Uncharacterized protein n=1 Tax=Flavobacterium piscinae TaxID=2506424 RepID=A0A4Q1KWB3_9FLAO|nr:hypothetical protein [Flavobacterium piscinae]MBC8883732.1 hypothetical protein [Flavobacterium piscinae]RXR33534.1 hypothetical protein EQG68_04720 [Flavobacterium piscinae]